MCEVQCSQGAVFNAKRTADHGHEILAVLLACKPYLRINRTLLRKLEAARQAFVDEKLEQALDRKLKRAPR